MWGDPPQCDTEADVNVPKPSVAATILRQAALLVEGDRAQQHGPKERNFQNIADHWNTYLKGRISPLLSAFDVGLMMVEMKVARAKDRSRGDNPDNFLDMAGYAGCTGEIAEGSRK